jgi:arginine:pyruvate transaminase
MPQMYYADRTRAIQGDTVDAWKLHYRGVAAQARGEDVILLSIGDPDLATPAPVVDAAVTALRGGDTHYSEIEGRAPLRELIARQHQAHCGEAVGAANVIVLAGAQNALFAASLCLLNPGDEAIVLQPMYVTYEACIQVTGATLVPVALDPERGFHLDREALAAAITPRTRAIYLASPGNPTGVVLDREELAAIAGLAVAHDLWVVSDEVYRDIVFEGEHVGIAGLPGMAGRTVTIGSLSKSHAMTGWRVGWVVAPEALVQHLSNLALCMLYGLPGFVQQAAVCALAEAQPEVARMREVYRARRDRLLSALADSPGLRCVEPQGSMFLLVDVRGTGLSAADFAERLFLATGVVVLDASAFGSCAAGHVRISYTAGDEALEEAARRIHRFAVSLAG